MTVPTPDNAALAAAVQMVHDNQQQSQQAVMSQVNTAYAPGDVRRFVVKPGQEAKPEPVPKQEPKVELKAEPTIKAEGITLEQVRAALEGVGSCSAAGSGAEGSGRIWCSSSWPRSPSSPPSSRR